MTAKAVMYGKTVEFNGVTYQFDNKEDAIGFKGCVESNVSGTRPGACADLWRCVSRGVENQGKKGQGE